MLLQFNFENYGPFKDEVSLNLEATPYSEYKEHVRILDSKKVLPLSVIFGANASGKSFVYKAFRYMRYVVCSSVNFDGNSSKDNNSSLIPPTPFKLDKESLNKPSMFEVILTNLVDGKEVTYQYGFSIFNGKIDAEWLFQLRKSNPTAGKELLRRERNVISINVTKIDEAIRTTLESSTQSQTLVLSLAAKLNVEPFRSILDFFAESIINDFASLFENISRDHTIRQELIDDENIRKDCVTFLQSFEPSIKDLTIEKQGEAEEFKVYTTHISKDGSEIRFKMEDESAGTQKMFLLYGDLREILASGKVLFIDELNARLHPLLLRNLLLLFINKERNPNNAQLIFTCHEPWILRAKTLRRDEIYFTNKDALTGEATLYSLAEFIDENGDKIRSDEDFEKNYLLGKYDGIPSLNSIEILQKGPNNK